MTNSFTTRKVYRFKRFYQVYHFFVGAAALVVAILFYRVLILSIPSVLFSMFMIWRPLIEAVTVDQSTVTYKTLFYKKSIRRSSITAVETQSNGKGASLILWSDSDQKEGLAIPDLFAWDEDWDHLWGSYRDSSDSKPISLF